MPLFGTALPAAIDGFYDEGLACIRSTPTTSPLSTGMLKGRVSWIRQASYVAASQLDLLADLTMQHLESASRSGGSYFPRIALAEDLLLSFSCLLVAPNRMW